jgi:TolC family type I secretion outer membrane protein
LPWGVLLAERKEPLRTNALRLALGFGIAVAGGSAPVANADDMFQAMATAYETNPDLASARADLRMQDEGVANALSGYRPSVSSNFSAGVSRVDNDGVDANTEPVTIGVSIDQPLYTGGRVGASVLQAENQVRAARAALASTEQSVLRNVGAAYMDVLQLRAILTLNQNNEDVLRRQLDATLDRFEVGEITRTDVSQAETRLARAQADRIAAQGNVDAAVSVYERIVDETPGNLQPAPAFTVPTSLEEALSLALQRNPTLLQAQSTLRAASAAVDGADATLRPSLNLTGRAQQAWDPSASVDDQTSFSATLQLSVPLYQAGRASSTARQRRQALESARRDLESTRRQVADQVIQAWFALTAARAEMIARQTQVDTAEVALEGVQQEATVGSRTVLDILDAEQEALNARVNLVSAERDSVVAELGLLSAVGALTAASLDLPVPLYDATVHYRTVRNRWWGVDTQ